MRQREFINLPGARRPDRCGAACRYV